VTRTSQHVVSVSAGNHEPSSKPDQLALQSGVLANTAHSQHLVVCPAGCGNPLVSGAQSWMVDLSRNAEIGRQIAGADQQNVDSVNGSYGFAILDTLRGFEHYDDRRLRVELLI
jgi:hypothetical protein